MHDGRPVQQRMERPAADRVQDGPPGGEGATSGGGMRCLQPHDELDGGASAQPQPRHTDGRRVRDLRSARPVLGRLPRDRKSVV